MTSLVVIGIGYFAMVAACGPWGVAAIVLHLGIMLLPIMGARKWRRP